MFLNRSVDNRVPVNKPISVIVRRIHKTVTAPKHYFAQLLFDGVRRIKRGVNAVQVATRPLQRQIA